MTEVAKAEVARLPELPADLTQQLVQSAAAVLAQWLSGLAAGRTVGIFVTDGNQIAAIVNGNAAALRTAIPRLGPQLEALASQMEGKGAV